MQLAPGGWRYIWGAVGLAIIGILLTPLVSVVLALVALFVAWFYRDPDRDPPETGVLSPADGTVSVIREDGDQLRVGVYMGPIDVHVNRAPLAGTVDTVDHEPGGHRLAFSKDSEHNERLRIGFGEWSVVLIAGAFARRITPYVEPEDAVDRGQRIGHIAFGSRADVILPPAYDRASLEIAEGDRVIAGETVIATEE